MYIKHRTKNSSCLERSTHNRSVVGLSPTGPTIFKSSSHMYGITKREVVHLARASI